MASSLNATIGSIATERRECNGVAASILSGAVALPKAALHVHVLGGRELYEKTDLFSNIDPYVVVRHGENVSRSIAHLEAGSTCDFDWRVSFPFEPRPPTEAPSSSNGGAEDSSRHRHRLRGWGHGHWQERQDLEFVVMDRNRVGKDDEVARGAVGHEKLAAAEGMSNAFRGSLLLAHQSRLTGAAKPGGFLDVVYWWEPLTYEPATATMSATAAGAEKNKQESGNSSDLPLLLPSPVLHCLSNLNVRGGLIREIIDGDGVFEPFRTWQMPLWMVRAVFGDETCAWNKSYHAAQKIYGVGVSCMAVRQMIRVQHSWLYSNDVKRGADAYYESTLIRGGQDFVRMLAKASDASSQGECVFPPPPASSRRRKTPRFTYVVLTDSSMHFSLTGRRTGVDMLSKHAVHACASESVVYAGEFFIATKGNHDDWDRRDAAGNSEKKKPTLVIDNNSGTFAPPKQRLPKLKLLLELNLGKELDILALDREDPLLKDLLKANDVE